MAIRQKILLPRFTETAVILAVFSCVAFILVPRVRLVLAETGEGAPIPALTMMIFKMSPGGLIAISAILGIWAGLGRLRSGSPWFARLALIVTALLGALILIGLSLPFIVSQHHDL